MRLVVGGESLVGSRTGIGNYTYNLCQYLLSGQHLTEIDLLVNGRLSKFERFIAGEAGAEAGQPVIAAKLATLRGKLSQWSPAVWTYQRVMPLRERLVLRSYPKDSVFHSPNYFLPVFPGKKIVTIPDLSTWHHPEWHSKASATLVNHHIGRAKRHADHIITISHAVKQEIIDHLRIDDSRITVTHLGASEQFQPVSVEDFQDTAKKIGIGYKGYFLFLATIEPRKNLPRLLDSYLLYRDKAGAEALPLVVSGHHGWKSDDVRERLRQLDSEGIIRYLGYTPSELARELVAGARALVYPTLYEGFGLPVLEAMQSATAVITSECTAAAEVGGNAVLLIDPESTEELTAALCRLSQDPGVVQTLEKAGRERALSFSWEACAQQTYAVYERSIHC